MNDLNSMPQCGFYVRTQVSEDPVQNTYEMVNINGPRGAGRLRLRMPPAVGDLIHLWDALKKSGGTFRVLERSWGHAEYGSITWPYGEPEPKEGPMLNIIVVKADGPFVDQVLTPDEEE